MKVSKSRGPQRLLFFLLLAWAGMPAWAQIDRSGITGRVTDPSGRILIGTHIVALENSTQLRREGLSDKDGRYDIPELPVGKYTVTFDQPGFETLTFLDVEQVVGVGPDHVGGANRTHHQTNRCECE